MDPISMSLLASAVGTGIGALGNMRGGFSGKPGGFKQLPLFNPQQQQAFSSQLQQGMENTNFNNIEDLARRRFNESIPGLAERFSSMGAGVPTTSAFKNILGRSQSDLEAQLAALRSQFGMQQLHMGLTPQFENYHEQRQPGMFEGGLGSLLSFLPMILKGFSQKREEDQNEQNLQKLQSMLSGLGGGNV